MKLFVAMLLISVSQAFGQLGRDAIFEHHDPRFRSFHPEKAYAIVTGQADGLMVQVPPKSAAKFLAKDCLVILPNGKQEKLHFAPMGKGLEGFWLAKFKLAKGINPKAGRYKYSLSVEIDGKTFVFSHELKYSFKRMDGLRSRSKQVDLAK